MLSIHSCESVRKPWVPADTVGAAGQTPTSDGSSEGNQTGRRSCSALHWLPVRRAPGEKRYFQDSGFVGQLWNKKKSREIVIVIIIINTKNNSWTKEN